MNYMNLLPPPYLEVLKFNRFLKKIAALWTAIFLFFVLLVSYLTLTNRYLYAQVANITNEISSGKFAESSALSADVKNLNARLSAYDRVIAALNLTPARNATVTEISAIAACLPDGATLKSVSIKHGTVTVTGYADDKLAVGMFYDALDARAGYGDINIVELTKSNEHAYYFKLEFSVNPESSR